MLMLASNVKLDLIIRHARDFHDGHWYVLSFTAGCKGNFGTPDLDFGTGRDEVLKLSAFRSIEELMTHMLEKPACGCIRLEPRQEATTSPYLAQPRNTRRYSYPSEVDDDLRLAADFTDAEHLHAMMKILALSEGLPTRKP
jgi:hypothetical protein